MDNWSFEKATNDERAFFFGVENDAEQLNLNDFRVAITSKSLLHHFNHYSFHLYHMDNTNKTNKSRFPFLAFGRSDFSGQFHPIAVCIMKREREDDYSWFLKALKNFCSQNLKINLEDKIKYAMIDACDAEYNVLKSVFPNCTVLMCWFHVMNSKMSLPQ